MSCHAHSTQIGSLKKSQTISSQPDELKLPGLFMNKKQYFPNHLNIDLKSFDVINCDLLNWLASLVWWIYVGHFCSNNKIKMVNWKHYRSYCSENADQFYEKKNNNSSLIEWHWNTKKNLNLIWFFTIEHCFHLQIKSTCAKLKQTNRKHTKIELKCTQSNEHKKNQLRRM